MTTYPQETEVNRSLAKYYKYHARVYNSTRWSFLFGRESLLNNLSFQSPPKNILEVGCGTGHNLLKLAKKYPSARITGVDLSDEMLKVAKKNLKKPSLRVSFLHQAYSKPLDPGTFDLILFSYSLTMMGSEWKRVLDTAHTDLATGGLIAVVDFHTSPSGFFRSWMRHNHVEMGGFLLPGLKSDYAQVSLESKSVYGGLWNYFSFVGQKI